MIRRPIKLIVSYDGTGFGGWQRQKNSRSVQEEIERALGIMHGHAVPVTGAGRTDSGVHAMGQVAGFFTDIGSIPAEKFLPALNKLMPGDVRILAASDASPGFHARFDASLRRYRYFILCGGRPDPCSLRYAHHLARTPRLELLNAMARRLTGERDFSTFASARDPSPSKCRFVTESVFFWDSGILVYQVAANAFLYRMVRSLVGSMLHFELESADASQAGRRMDETLRSLDREAAGPTAPARGLFLWNVEYGPRVHGPTLDLDGSHDDAEKPAADKASGSEDETAVAANGERNAEVGRRLVPGIGYVEG
jgi:tRNA pseudouridine38-40 synthase